MSAPSSRSAIEREETSDDWSVFGDEIDSKVHEHIKANRFVFFSESDVDDVTSFLCVRTRAVV